MSGPTLVLVHGAWYGPWAWQPLMRRMADTDVRTVALTTVGGDPSRLGDMPQDAAAVRAAVDAIDGPVVVCAHSYGGIPVTEGLADAANVVGLVYLCAFQISVGESLLGSLGGVRPDWWDVHEDAGHIDVQRPEEVFFQDCDPQIRADAGAKVRASHMALGAKHQTLTTAAWSSIPSTYVVCAQDRALPPDVQRAMSQRSGSVVELEASHSPFLSMPDQVVELLDGELLRRSGAGS